MKQGIVKFSKEYVTETGLKEWAGIELPFNEERESGVDALRRAETIVNEYQRHKSYLMQYEMIHPAQYTPSKIVEPAQVEIGVSVNTLYSCVDLPTLDAYRLIVKGKPDLEAAYNAHRKLLVKSESDALLAASRIKPSYESLDDNK